MLSVKSESCLHWQHILRASRSSHEAQFKIPSAAYFAILEAFPLPIARALLEGKRAQDVSRPNVSLLFTDIVGFTKMSSEMRAEKVSSLLNRLYQKFDLLSYHHGVQKIDIVGDSYIAATNFTEEQNSDHAARLARWAIDAVAEAAKTTLLDEENPSLGFVQIRVGMHTGPVCGTVLGRQAQKYTLIGDSVNIASRMESTSEAGRIQCSEAFALVVQDQVEEIFTDPR